MTYATFRIRPNLYRDSVALMQLAAALLEQPGLRRASALMATPANLAIAANSGHLLPQGQRFSPDDLVIFVEADGPPAATAALDWAEQELARPVAPAIAGTTPERPPTTLADGLGAQPASNLAFIAVPGPYAASEALKALRAGLHVVLFSSGVTLADEARLKRVAVARGLLMLGAECGSAIIGGVPLGFANLVRPGPIGLVAASGTGLQELTCLIDRWGGGVSQAIGVGGRDLSEEVGGTMMLAGLRLLLDDPVTEAIVLLSKPPAPAVAARILDAAAAAAKPVVLTLLGADPATATARGLAGARTLEEAARLALAAVGMAAPTLPDPLLAPLAAPRRFVRGLFAGGTLCAEAALILRDSIGPVVVADGDHPFPAAHSLLDLGDEPFTVGRPHPMIDGRLRAELLLQAARDPATAVLLFDLVLGYGASMDPAGPLLEALGQVAPDARPRLVAHVCGTNADPQSRAVQLERLRAAGVLVAETNAQAARCAAAFVGR